MHEVKAVDETSRQIPWAKKTQVVSNVMDWREKDIAVDHIELQVHKPWALAEITDHGHVEVEIDSEEVIRNYMKKSIALTRSLRRFMRLSEGTDLISEAKNWLAGFDPEAFNEPEPPGVLDWEPPGTPSPWKKLGTVGPHRSGSSRMDFSDDWIGSKFPFVHALFDRGPDEGLIINWNGDPSQNAEVWVGDVDGFLLANMERFEDPESYLDWNARFENGWIWALQEMGVFRDGNVPDWAIDILSVDPDVMWPEIVEELLPQLESLKPELRTAVLQWLENRQREREKATGQLRIWPEREQS